MESLYKCWHKREKEIMMLSLVFWSNLCIFNSLGIQSYRNSLNKRQL